MTRRWIPGLTALIIATTLTGSIHAQRIEPPDNGLDSDFECEDAVSDYQSNVKKCLEDAGTLDEAKQCGEF
jgi:hypothetical protein